MKTLPMIAVGEIAAGKLGAVTPSQFPDEVFDLHSIPAFDSRMPDVVAGREIGSSK